MQVTRLDRPIRCLNKHISILDLIKLNNSSKTRDYLKCEMLKLFSFSYIFFPFLCKASTEGGAHPGQVTSLSWGSHTDIHTHIHIHTYGHTYVYIMEIKMNGLTCDVNSYFIVGISTVFFCFHFFYRCSLFILYNLT